MGRNGGSSGWTIGSRKWTWLPSGPTSGSSLMEVQADSLCSLLVIFRKGAQSLFLGEFQRAIVIAYSGSAVFESRLNDIFRDTKFRQMNFDSGSSRPENLVGS